MLCEAATLAPLQHAYGFTHLYRAYAIAKADIGWHLECRTCHAQWVAREHIGECLWCDRREELQRNEERERLLNPPWQANGFDGLYAPTDAAVSEWLDECALGIAAGLITIEEVRTLVARFTTDADG